MPPPPPSSRSLPANLTGMTDQAFLRHLATHGAASRAEIARATGISKPTISDSATRLHTAGMIAEVGESTPRGRGRRALLYGINPGYCHVSAVVLERRHFVVRALDFRGELQWERQYTEDVSFSRGIAWAKEQLAAAATAMDTPCHSATISVAAPVDPHTGAVQPMAGAPLGGFVPDIIAELGLLHVPQVRVDNDVNWAALAEATDPDKEPGRSFLYIYLGAGIGGAQVAEGTVVRGANGAAGEISFLRTPHGTTLHAELSSLSFGSPDKSSIDIDLALAAFQDPDNTEAEYAAELLGQAVLDAATVVDPGTVILSGPLSAADLLVERVSAAVEAGHIAPVSLMRGRPDEELLVTGVSRDAIRNAWETAMEVAGTLAESQTSE